MTAFPQFYLGSVDIPGWHQLASFTVWNPDGGSGTAQPYTCIVNGRFSIFFPMCGTARDDRDKGFICVSFDEDGSTCIYQSPDYATYGPATINASWNVGQAQNFYQTGNTFKWQGLHGSYQVVIPNSYQAGKTLVVTPTLFAIPPPPCGQGSFDQTTFIDNGGFVAFEYSRAFGENNNFYVTIMRNNAIVGAGFLGNFPGNLDPFIRYQLQLPPTVSISDLRYKNGAFTFCSFGSSGQKYVGATSLQLNGEYSALNCATATDVYVSPATQFNINVGTLTGNPTHYTGASNAYWMCCDIPLTYATPTFTSDGQYASFSLYNQFQFLDIRVVMPGVQSQALFPNGLIGVNSKTKRAYVGFQSGSMNATFTIWSAPLPNIVFKPGNFSISQHDGLYNYHRAVSPHGTFQA